MISDSARPRVSATSLTSENSSKSSKFAVIPLAAFVLVVAFVLSGGAPISRPQAAGQTPDESKVVKEFYTPKDRQAAMHSALLFTPTKIADIDVAQGPPQSKKQFIFHLNDKVTCDFDKPGAKMGGKTPKFSCKLTKVESSGGQTQTLIADMDEEPVKVKFGADNREVYAEVVSTRLMWALGYYADAWFPVRVVCNNCPDNPESGSGSPATRNYDQATIVRKADGHKMYEVGKEEEGWSWKELDQFNGRPTYERDGLKLLGAFMQHSDNKPPQQRLVCDHVKVDQTTNPFTTTCGESRMLVQDVGATFGSGGWFTSNGGAKVNLGNWSGKHLWKKTGKPGTPEADCPVCQAALTKSLTATDGLSDPTISEEGRRFLAGLMCQLSDQQIEALFKTARLAEMPDNKGKDEAAVVRSWVDAFKAKREELASGRCRWNQKPADLNAIDNPSALPTVPSFCSAKPF
jgi:hypothetical protein